jgi:hypothetical protein
MKALEKSLGRGGCYIDFPTKEKEFESIVKNGQ